jgi:energy-coupling factor transporter ATP-binding protein EcfA2
MNLNSTHARRRCIELPGIIVELIGPSGSGKSTLARAIVAAFPEARLVASARPAEEPHGRFQLPPFMARAIKLVSLVPRPFGGLTEEDTAVRLMLSLLPTSRPLWRLRYWRYLTDLTTNLRREREAGGVTVLDQGFINAVGTLASLGRGVAKETLARALDMAPRPNLIVRIEAPRDVIAGRLRSRLGAQSPAERLFEPSIPETLRQIDVFRALGPIIDDSGIPSVQVLCPDRGALEKATATVLDRIASLRAEIMT